MEIFFLPHRKFCKWKIGFFSISLVRQVQNRRETSEIEKKRIGLHNNDESFSTMFRKSRKDSRLSPLELPFSVSASLHGNFSCIFCLSIYSCPSDDMNFSPFNASTNSGSNLSPMYLKNPYSFMPVDTLHSMGYQTGSLGQWKLRKKALLNPLNVYKYCGGEMTKS
jgi:hypothetical protein